MPGLSFRPQRLTGSGGEKRVPSPEAGCRSGRKPTGLGFAGAGDVTIYFSSAGRQGEKAVILCSVMTGEWVFVCLCVWRMRRERGGQGTKEKKRRSSARKV